MNHHLQFSQSQAATDFGVLISFSLDSEFAVGDEPAGLSAAPLPWPHEPITPISLAQLSRLTSRSGKFSDVSIARRWHPPYHQRHWKLVLIRQTYHFPWLLRQPLLHLTESSAYQSSPPFCHVDLCFQLVGLVET